MTLRSRNKRSRNRHILKYSCQIIITSYASFRQDFDAYKAGKYDYLILDEAQVMKNTQTKIAQYLRDFSVPHCLALSGTPIENHLLEIWSIFHIILPGLLPAKKTFLKLTPKEVARYISPFILRRKKEEVLPDLPDLIEITHQSELSDAQKAIYLAQLQQMQQGLISASDQEINRRKVEILSGITRLRQICDTPALFMDYAGDSGKLDSLRELLSQIKESDHRVLIFSQFRGMLDITEGLLQELGISSYKLTGSTPSDSRQEMTRAFNQGSLYKVILLIRIDIEASPQHFDIQIADLHDKRMFPVLGNLEVPLDLQTGDTLSVDIGVGQRAFRIQFDRTLIRQGQLHLISGRNFRQERRVRILQFMQKRKVPRRNGQDGNHGRRHHDTGPAYGDFRRMYLQTKSPMNFPLTTDFHRRINRILIPKRFHPFGQFLVRKMIQGLLEALEVFPVGLSA